MVAGGIMSRCFDAIKVNVPLQSFFSLSQVSQQRKKKLKSIQMMNSENHFKSILFLQFPLPNLQAGIILTRWKNF